MLKKNLTDNDSVSVRHRQGRRSAWATAQARAHGL